MITDIKKMGESMAFNKPVDEIKELNLSYKDYIFTIEFASLDYTMPKKNQYAYMLSGLDDNWIMAGNNRSVTYSNLPAGDYTFKVKGSNNDGVWNEEGVSLEISIRPPIWKTLWFYSLMVFLFVGGSLLFIILRIRALKQAKKNLQSVVEARTVELSAERDNLKEANTRVIIHLEEIEAQRDEIEAQRDDIIQKNRTLERAIGEIQWQNREIKEQKTQIELKSADLEKAQLLIQNQNKQLKFSNHILEERVSQRTDELKFAYQDLLRAHKQLDHFTYRSAHDLKGPIARLLGLCYIGKMEVEEEKAIEYFSRLENSAIEMSNLLNRLMQTHEIKTKQIQPSSVNIQSVVLSVWEKLLVQEKHQLMLDMELGSFHISTDEPLFEIMLSNILENAIRFSLPEEKEAWVKVTIAETELGQFAISITDNGRGIPVEVANKVFEMFVIGTQDGKGDGIGLYEAQVIAERLKGKIWLKNSEKGYTEFEVILPNSYGER
jgi:signal transduction histidine kinase